MPNEVQKTIDLILTNCENTFAYLDDKLIVTKRSKSTFQQLMYMVLSRLNLKKLAISLEKGKFACEQVECLGYKISNEGALPGTRKTEAISKLSSPKMFKQRKSFLRSRQHLTRLIETSQKQHAH